MITLSFSWVWIVVIIVFILGIIGFFYFSKDSGDGPAGGLSVMLGCGVFLITLVICLVIGGIFLW